MSARLRLGGLPAAKAVDEEAPNEATDSSASNVVNIKGAGTTNTAPREASLKQARRTDIEAEEHPDCEPDHSPSSDFSELTQTITPFSNQQCDNETNSEPSSSSSSPSQALVRVESAQQDKLNKDTDDNTPKKMTDSPAKKVLNKEEQARLSALKSMLNASNTRYQQATRNRRPVFAAGLEVKVVKGDFIGEHGTVLDADYIENRALISLNSTTEPRWIGFRSLGHAD